MALIHCPECNKEISDNAITCPHCGYPLATVSSNVFEKYSSYFEHPLKAVNLYCGKNRGYVLDSYIDPDDLESMKGSYRYVSYSESLSLLSGYGLHQLKNIYDNYSIGEADLYSEIKEEKVLSSSGIFVRHEEYEVYKSYIMLYVDFYNKTIKRGTNLITINGMGNPIFHQGDFLLLGVNRSEIVTRDLNAENALINSIKRQIDTCRKKAALSRTALEISKQISPAEKKVMSVTTSTMIGGAIAGTTGALIGLVQGIERNTAHRARVEQYEETIKNYVQEAEEQDKLASELEILMCNVPKIYSSKPGEVAAVGIRTLFGIIPVSFPKGKFDFEIKIDEEYDSWLKLEKYCGREKYTFRSDDVERYVSDKTLLDEMNQRYTVIDNKVDEQIQADKVKSNDRELADLLTLVKKLNERRMEISEEKIRESFEKKTSEKSDTEI